MDISVLNALNFVLRPLKSKLSSLIARGKIESIQDGGDFQQAQVTFSDEHSQNDVPRIQNFGFTSHPPKESEALIVHLGGEKNFPIIVSADHREKRLKDLDEGESAVYNAEGSKIHLKNGGKVVIDNGTFELISLINDLTQALASMTVPSPAGPVPPINLADFITIKAKLETFQE